MLNTKSNLFLEYNKLSSYLILKRLVFSGIIIWMDKIFEFFTYENQLLHDK